MSAELNIIDIASSIMRSANKALKNMVDITLKELPEVGKLEVVQPRIIAPLGVFTSLVTFQQSGKNKSTKGAVVLYIAHTDLKPLFGSLGIDSLSPQAEIKDICGEFCNIIAGGFKTEIVSLGYNDVSMSPPSNYAECVNISIENLSATRKYKFNFSHKNEALFGIEVFMEGVA